MSEEATGDREERRSSSSRDAPRPGDSEEQSPSGSRNSKSSGDDAGADARGERATNAEAETADGAGVDVDFGDDGLVPAVAQDAGSGEVLMVAYASPEALSRTRETGRAHYYSRSREELWEKGATSGNVQRIEEVRVDCDADTLLYLVDQEGGACHTGHRSCFHRTVDGEAVGERVFDPEEVY